MQNNLLYFYLKYFESVDKMLSNNDYFMGEALRQAQLAFDADEIPVGAVVACKGKIIGKGYNQTQRLNDVTAHAEMIAITSASSFLGSKYLNDCILYVTLEPCIMCAGAIAWAQLGGLVFGTDDKKKGFTIFNQDVLHPRTLVSSGVLKDDCEEILKYFFLKLRKK